jgi:hypothetical protein
MEEIRHTETDPTSLVLFHGEITDEGARVALASTVGHSAGNMGYKGHTDAHLSSMGGLWASFVYAPVTRTHDGGTCRTIPIPRPVNIVDGLYLLGKVEKAAQAFQPGVYTGHMYITLSNPKWTPCIQNEIFHPRKGACNAEFGFCNLRRVKQPLQPQLTPSVVSRWVAEFRAVFEC